MRHFSLPLTLCLCLMGAGGALAEPGATHADRTFTAHTSANECAECHNSQPNQWSTGAGQVDPIAVVGGGTATASIHALAWQDALFREESSSMGNPGMCQRCHIPTSAFDAHRSQLVYAPNSRGEGAPNASEGVTCVSCHLGADGLIHAPDDDRREARIAEEDEHEVVRDPWMATAEFCATCHNDPVFGSFTRTYDEWADAPLNNKPCQSCHMYNGSHVWPGGHSASKREDGLVVEVPTRANEGDQLSLSLQNTRAGHNVPTGDTFRSYIVRVTITGANGQVVAEREAGVAAEIRTPIFYAEEVRTRLDPVSVHGAREMALDSLPAGSYTLTTELSYQLTREVTLQYRRKSEHVEPSPELAIGSWTDALTICPSASPCAEATTVHDPG